MEVGRAGSARGELVLRRRADGALELRANGVFVMDTVETTTERALATRALELVDDPRAVLVGGLGLGFTAREVLADQRVATCTVVEIEPALIGWMRDGTVPDGPRVLADPRLEVVEADVAAVLRDARPASYDLVLLDVDNGPGQLVHETNSRLYDVPALARVRRLLRRGGVLVIWSAEESPTLHAALETAFGAAELVRLPVRLQGREESYVLQVARTGHGA